MPTTLSAEAVEESTFVITASFTDENGAAVTPNAGLTWTLTDEKGTIINSRENVAIISTPSVTIVLTGDDLRVLSADNFHRVVTLKGTYNSSLGNNLFLKDEVRFDLYDLVAESS